MKRLRTCFLTLVFLGLGGTAYASWLSWVGVACTVTAVGAVATANPVGVGVGGVLAITEIGLVATDIGLSFFGAQMGSYSGPGTDPILAANISVMGPALMGAEFQHLPVPETDLEDAVIATNTYIDNLNTFIGHVADEEDAAVIASDLMAMSASLEDMADELDTVGAGTLSLTATQLQDAFDEIDENGLPQFEIDILESAGLDEDYIDPFTAMHLVIDPGDIGTISVSELLRESADAYFEIAFVIASQEAEGGGDPIDP